MQQQAVAQLAHGHGWLLREILQDAGRRRVAQQEKFISHERDRRLAVEKPCLRHGMIQAVRQQDAMREGKFLVAVFQMGRKRDNVAVKEQRLAVRGGFEAVGVPPACEPLEQFGVSQQQRRLVAGAFAVRVVNPLYELPVPRREQLLLMRGADD